MRLVDESRQATPVSYDADPHYEVVNISVTAYNNGNNWVNSSRGWIPDPNNRTRANLVHTFDSSNLNAVTSLPILTECKNVTLLPAIGDTALSGVDCFMTFSSPSCKHHHCLALKCTLTLGYTS